ncbi:MAG: hypothetical protein QXV42_01625 [Ignisphaera sp.]
MGVEDEATRKIIESLIRNFNLTLADQIYTVRLRDEDYREKAIKLATNDYPNLGKYYYMFVSPLLQYLGPGKGAQRYRPLAVYFITRDEAFRMLYNYLYDDIEQDIISEGHGKDTIKLITVLSAGGGFGSGSFIAIHTLLATLLMARECNFTSKIILNLPIGQNIFIPEPADQTPIDGLDGTEASSAALLLELLYLHRMRPRSKPHGVDNIIKIAGERIGLNIEKFIGVDEIVITSLANVTGGSLREIFDLHDEEVGRFLYPEISAELGPLRENLAKNYGEYMNHISGLPIEFAKELLIPVTVVGVASIQIDPNKTSGLVEKITETLKKLEDTVKYKDDMRKKRDQLSKELEASIIELNRLEKEYQDIKLDNVRRNEDIIRRLNEIANVKNIILNNIASLNRKIDELNVTQDFNIAEQHIIGFENLFVNLANLRDLLTLKHELDNSIENAKKLLAETLSKDAIINLVKQITFVEASLDILQILLTSLNDLSNRINRYKESIEPSMLDRIKNRAKCKTYSRSETIHKTIIERRDELDKHVNSCRKDLEHVKNIYNIQLRKLENEINNINNRIKNLKEEIENTNNAIQNAILQEGTTREELQKLYGDLSRELLRDFQKYYGNLLREISLEEFVKTLSKSIISNKGDISKNVGINLIIEVIRNINDEVANNIVAAMATYMNNLKYFVNIDPGDVYTLARIVGISNIELINRCLSESIYIVVSPDNEKLANEIVRRLGRNINIFKIDNAKTSFITYIRRRIVTPIQIKEVRESLKKFFEVVMRKTGEATINEYRGLAYLTLDINNKDFMDYLENIKKSLEKFEEEYNKLIH